MKGELGGRTDSLTRGQKAPWLEGLIDAVPRFPQRIHDRRFWQVQALVIFSTAPHYVIESLGVTNPFETFHGLTITLYVVPLFYAAITFGWEGAILTSLWMAILTTPSIWIWHRSSYHWLSELGQLAITLPVGLMVAWRVDLETKQRLRAERTSASLGLLNEIGERLNHALEVEQALPGVVRLMLLNLPVETVWLCLEPDESDGDLTVILESRHSTASALTNQVDRLHRQVAETGEPLQLDDGVLVTPLLGENGIIGTLGVMAQSGRRLPDEQTRLLPAIVHEIRVDIENARLYRQRQETLQFYAQQVTQAQEDERLRIARELHDETAQELVHIVRRLERLGEAAEGAMSTRIDELLALARGTLKAVRRYSRDLRPSVLDDLGLVPAIELTVEEVNDRLPGGARLHVVGSPCRLDSPVELAFFRIAQEALHNVEKHAAAKSATVDLEFDDESIRLVVADDGRGCKVPQNISDLARRGKLGILGMKERAELVGGSFMLESGDGGGCRVIVEVASTAAVRD